MLNSPPLEDKTESEHTLISDQTSGVSNPYNSEFGLTSAPPHVTADTNPDKTLKIKFSSNLGKPSAHI